MFNYLFVISILLLTFLLVLSFVLLKKKSKWAAIYGIINIILTSLFWVFYHFADKNNISPFCVIAESPEYCIPYNEWSTRELCYSPLILSFDCSVLNSLRNVFLVNSILALAILVFYFLRRFVLNKSLNYRIVVLASIVIILITLSFTWFFSIT